MQNKYVKMLPRYNRLHWILHAHKHDQKAVITVQHWRYKSNCQHREVEKFNREYVRSGTSRATVLRTGQKVQCACTFSIPSSVLLLSKCRHTCSPVIPPLIKVVLVLQQHAVTPASGCYKMHHVKFFGHPRDICFSWGLEMRLVMEFVDFIA